METLDAPVFEVKQDSEWYKETAKRKEAQKEFFKEVNEEYFTDNGFVFYHEEYFGIDGDSKDYEMYKSELKKHPDKNNIYIFKKRSKYYPIFKEKLAKFQNKYSPFKAHDVLGMNNMTASQWVDGRWFYGVKNADQVEGREVEPIDYKEYLKIVMDALEEETK